MTSRRNRTGIRSVTKGNALRLLPFAFRLKRTSGREAVLRIAFLLRRHSVIPGAVAHLELRRVRIVLRSWIDLDLDAAKLRIREPRAWIVSDQILGAQLVTDLPEG